MAALNPAFAASGTTIFTTMSALALEHECANLGQGFPDVDGPRTIKKVAAEHLLAQPQQYSPAGGVPELRAAIAEHSRVHSGLPLGDNDDDKSGGSDNVVVTAGATEALAAAILGVAAPGDRVVLLDPSYDSYAPMVRAAGAEPVALALRPPTSSNSSPSSSTCSPSPSSSSSWSLPPKEELERALGDPRAKLLVVNSPHNPTGKVLTREELEEIAEVVRAKDPEGTRLFLLLDEVYQHLVHPTPTTTAKFEKEKEKEENQQQQQQQQQLHVSLATLPGMAQRSIRVGSAGKTFSLTGFKVGWATSSNRELLSATFRAHQFLTFCVPPSLQAGVAAGFRREASYFLNLGAELAEKRTRLSAWIEKAGFVPLPAEGTYFLVGDAAALMNDGETDADFCIRLAKEGGVATIPLSALYADRGHAPRTLVRFCFCKRDEVLDEAGRRLVAFWAKNRKS